MGFEVVPIGEFLKPTRSCDGLFVDGDCDVIVQRFEQFSGEKATRVPATNSDEREKAPAKAEAKKGKK